MTPPITRKNLRALPDTELIDILAESCMELTVDPGDVYLPNDECVSLHLPVSTWLFLGDRLERISERLRIMNAREDDGK